jgi:hypothetical protein
MADIKKCPYCAEEIKDNARICKHCHIDLRTGKHIYQEEVPNWVLVVLLFVFLGVIIAYGYINTKFNLTSPAEVEANVQVSNPKTATVRPLSYVTNTPKNTPSEYFLLLTKKAQEKNTCIDWKDVNYTHFGKEICIRGIARRWYSTDYFATVIRFTENPKDFFIVDSAYIYEDFGPGSCFQAVGVIDEMGERLYMQVTEGLYYCEP